MIRSKLIAPILLAGTLFAGTASADGFMNVPDIEGESDRAGYEDQIDIRRVSYSVANAATSRTGSARQRSAATVGDVLVEKGIDASSPYLFQASAQGKVFKDIVLTLQTQAAGAPMEYMVVTLSNVRISGVEADIVPGEESTELVTLGYEKISIKYTELANNGSAGDEHEIEYDVSAGR